MASTALTWRTALPSTRGTYRAKPGSPRDTHPQQGTQAMQTGRAEDSLGRPHPALPCKLRTGHQAQGSLAGPTPAPDWWGRSRDRSACRHGPAWRLQRTASSVTVRLGPWAPG